jgi:hypothetical protein
MGPFYRWNPWKSGGARLTYYVLLTTKLGPNLFEVEGSYSS